MTPAVGPLLVAGALLVAPLPLPAVARLAAVLPGPARRPSWRRWRWRPPGRWSAVVAGVLAFVAVLGAGLMPVPALAAGLLAAALVRAVGRGALRRREDQELDAVVEAVSALAAELRAGQQPDAALGAAARAADGAPAAVLSAAAGTSRLGGSAAAVLREAPGCTRPARVVLARLAAGWRLGEAAGAPLSAVLAQADRSARAERTHRRQVAALLAAPRTTAALLAALPVLGLALGAAMGTHPLQSLLHTAAGQGALLLGVLLELAGLAWTGRIVRSAGAAP